jgi:hypothetical protein
MAQLIPSRARAVCHKLCHRAKRFGMNAQLNCRIGNLEGLLSAAARQRQSSIKTRSDSPVERKYELVGTRPRERRETPLLKQLGE